MVLRDVTFNLSVNFEAFPSSVISLSYLSKDPAVAMFWFIIWIQMFHEVHCILVFKNLVCETLASYMLSQFVVHSNNF